MGKSTAGSKTFVRYENCTGELRRVSTSWKRLGARVVSERGWGFEFLRYCTLGLLPPAVDFSIYFGLYGWLLASGMGDTKAGLIAHSMVSRPIGGLVCFFVHRRYTFRVQGKEDFSAHVVRFWVLFAMSWALTTLLIFLFGRVLNLSAGIGKVLAETLAFLFNFCVFKLWVLR